MGAWDIKESATGVYIAKSITVGLAWHEHAGSAGARLWPSNVPVAEQWNGGGLAVARLDNSWGDALAPPII